MVRNTFSVFAGAAVLSIGAIAGSASAAVVYNVGDGAIPLSNLAGTDNSLQVGDKIFDNFEYVRTGADMPIASDVSIMGVITNVNGTDMWGFRLIGGFRDSNTPGASDALLTYNVHVVDPNLSLISGAYIAGNPIVFGQGEITVTETFIPLGGDPFTAIYDIDGVNKKLQDQVTFQNPTGAIAVQKDILASVPTGQLGNAANMSFVDQLFTQVPGAGVPEPASLGVLGIGAVALLARRRK